MPNIPVEILANAQSYATLVIGVAGAASAIFMALTGRGFNAELWAGSNALLGAHALGRVANGGPKKP